MKVRENAFLNAIRAGKPQIGLWVSLGSGFTAEAIAGAQFDWYLIDMEHSPTDLNAVLAQLQVFAAYDTTAVVRPPWNDMVAIKQLLDAGAQNLLIPMVQDAEETQAAVAAMRYPPNGVRGVSVSTRANQFGRDSDYFVRCDRELGSLIQVETLSAIEKVSEISAVDGVDGVFFGPADIGADMGILGQPMHPDIWKAIMPAAQKLMDQGVPVGTLVSDPAFAKDLIGKGFTFVACGSDLGLLARGADNLIKTMRG